MSFDSKPLVITIDQEAATHQYPDCDKADYDLPVDELVLLLETHQQVIVC